MSGHRLPHVHDSTTHLPFVQFMFVVHSPPLAAPSQQTGGRSHPFSSGPSCGKSTPPAQIGGVVSRQVTLQEQDAKSHCC